MWLRVSASLNGWPRSQSADKHAKTSLPITRHISLSSSRTSPAQSTDSARVLDPYDVDRVLFQYSRAAKELWKYCNLGNVEVTARFIHEDAAIDWWERGAFRER